MKEINLPEDKLYYSIGEVGEIFDLEAHTLRRWEDEFSDLNPGSSPGGQRRYHRTDLETVARINHLLNEEKFSLDGAREKLANWDQYSKKHRIATEIKIICEETLDEINKFIEKI
jgi:DNA-binding transcriptional MerR regulator